MCSRLIFRSIQSRVPLLIGNRFLSLTQIQSMATTKLKEKKTTDDETSSQDQVVKPSSTSATVPDINKTYSDKIHRIVGEISKLSLVEVMDLNELLKVNNCVDRERVLLDN